MRAPQFVDDFLSWRWAPCALLTLGSLSYVGLAIVLIPSPADMPIARRQPSYLRSSYERAAPPISTRFAAALAEGPLSTHSTVTDPNAGPAAVVPAFSPLIERPEPSRLATPAPEVGASPPAPAPYAPSAP